MSDPTRHTLREDPGSLQLTSNNAPSMEPEPLDYARPEIGRIDDSAKYSLIAGIVSGPIGFALMFAALRAGMICDALLLAGLRSRSFTLDLHQISTKAASMRKSCVHSLRMGRDNHDGCLDNCARPIHQRIVYLMLKGRDG